jgi:adenylylsulfate kinase-like enzyme
MILSLYGQPGSGKTTLATMMRQRMQHDPFWRWEPILLDGDRIRQLFKNYKYGKAGRCENIKNINAIATYHDNFSENDVIISAVNPYAELRKELKQNNKVLEVLLISNRDLRKEYHVKEFENGEPDLIINTDETICDSYKRLEKLCAAFLGLAITKD